jgi:hypothetical protein
MSPATLPRPDFNIHRDTPPIRRPKLDGFTEIIDARLECEIPTLAVAA